MAKTKRSSLCSDLCRRERSRRIAAQWYEDNKDRAREVRNQKSFEFREEQTLRSLFNGVKNRCKERNIPFNLEFEDIDEPEVCPVFKTPFERRTQYAMSIDRIDPKLGYVKGNVQIMSRLANAMKQNATPEQLKMFANWVQKEYND